MKNPTITLKMDFLGIGLSLLCAIHCILTPIMIGVLPLYVEVFLENESLELIMITLSIAIASIAVGRGAYFIHGKTKVVYIFLAGVLLILIGHTLVSEELEKWVSSCGAFLIAVSHIMNWKYSRTRLSNRIN